MILICKVGKWYQEDDDEAAGSDTGANSSWSSLENFGSSVEKKINGSDVEQYDLSIVTMTYIIGKSDQCRLNLSMHC